MAGLNKGERIALALFAAFIAAALIWAARASESGVRTEKAASPEEIMAGEGDAYSDSLAPGETVDINSAGARELQKLPGIGETLAERIISYRSANGPFSAIEDIMSVDGIGEGKFQQMKDSITAK